MNTLACRVAGFIFFVISAANLFASGSGLNIVVVVNQNSTNSLQLGNYYCEKRGVPPQNVLRINWTGANVNWTRSEFETILRAPLDAMLTSRQLSNQIDYVLLSMDIPYRVTNNLGTVEHNFSSTTADLHYGFKDNPLDPFVFCTLPNDTASAYVGSEGIFRQTPPISATSNSWLVMMCSSSNLSQAKAIVDRGVAADNTFPTQIVYLAKSDDIARNIRYQLFENTRFNTRLRGNYDIQLTNVLAPFFLGALLGYENGYPAFGIAPNNFVPGAMADSLTSFGGSLLEESGQTDVHDFLNGGATASYGTVTEPCAYLEKFPSTQNYFYQSRGFSIAESYYMSVTNPYQGLLVGEPLSAPFALPCSGGWSNLPANSVLSGTTNLSLGFVAPDVTRPVQRVDLYVDGTLAQTLTNRVPAQNNRLYVTLPGATNIPYTVPSGATIATVASDLSALLNSLSGTTKIGANVFGDRIELQSTDINRSGSATFVVTSNYIGSASALATFVRPARSNCLDSIAFGMRSYLVGVGVVSNDVLSLTVTKTNNAVVSVSITNFSNTATLDQFLQTFVNTINATPALQGADGLVAEDLMPWDANYRFFNLRARGQGWNAARIRAQITGDFDIFPTGDNQLDQNLGDLQPRNHLYVTAGLTNLPITFGFNTTTQADGFHELTAVAYEGSHVQTQIRVSQSVLIQNTPLSATLTNLLGGTNTALEATLQFQVVANTNTISRIELFSTGGSWGVASNVQTANFSIAATNLGIGLHPFYALVTRNDNKQYRTDTKWIRIIGAEGEGPFALSAINTTPTLTWPATAGRRYEILSTTNITTAFALRDAVIPTNSVGIWSETNKSSPQRFYRARATP